MSLRFRLALVALLFTTACGRRYWVPGPDQTRQAEAVAKLYALQYLSDQAGQPEWMRLSYSPENPEIEYPIAFTFGGTPYSRYRIKYWGGRAKGRRLIHVLYFDPRKVENWEDEAAEGEFPDHFRVAVDIDTLRATESFPEPKPPAAGESTPRQGDAPPADPVPPQG